MIHNPRIRIYVNKLENRITSENKTGYYLELLTSEKMKLLRSTRNRIPKNKNWVKVSHLEITEVLLVHFNIVNSDH